MPIPTRCLLALALALTPAPALAASPTPTVTRSPGETIYEWESRDSPAVESEERTPSWFLTYARVEASDFGGWAEVARTSRDLFAAASGAAPSVDALVQGWGLSSATEDARVDRAVRFVQDEIRYLGLEMGRNSHQPHPPAQTLERRFGDCKDKAALLVTHRRRRPSRSPRPSRSRAGTRPPASTW